MKYFYDQSISADYEITVCSWLDCGHGYEDHQKIGHRSVFSSLLLNWQWLP